MNLAAHVSRIAARSPDRAAIVFEGKQLTYGVLDACANALTDALTRHGVGRGDRVALYMPNIPAFALVYLAVLRAGAIAVSINAIFKSEEVKYIVDDSGAKVVFTTAELLPQVRRDACPWVVHTIVCEGDPAGAVALETWLTTGSPAFRACTMDPDDVASILYSSGTTGFPKGVMLTHRNIETNTRTAAKYSDMRASDRIAVFLPLFHVFAQNYIMNGAFQTGSTLVLFRRFVPDTVIAGIARERVTMFFAVPTIFIALVNAQAIEASLASVRYWFSAAATMPQEVSRRWHERFGRPIFEGYGLTECAPFAAYNHLSEHRFGAVGTAVEGFELRIVDENDHAVSHGQWGEIVIRGPGVMKGYWGKPADTHHALRGGWLHSGDIGTMDQNGYVFIVDRVKDMINVSGFKVWPAEVENLLYQHPAIRELAVYGAPHPEKGESVRAAVVLRDGAVATQEDIIRYCRDRMAVYKAPERVDIVKELPKSATGKILKRLLRNDALRAS
ncbi:MAG: long-chain-fatty-acid--CoA ligase [Burkholderiales bacterium]